MSAEDSLNGSGMDADADILPTSTTEDDSVTSSGRGAGDADISSTSDDSQNQLDISEKASAMKEHDVPEEELAEAEKVKNALDKELEENDGWLKILGNNEIMKKVIKEGTAETRPLRGEICTIRLEGRLASDESVFEFHEKFTFQLGDVEVITGLDMAIPLMCKGEVATIKVSPRFAYGAKGLEPKIPPNSHLIFEVELIDFENEKDLAELSVKERREIGNRKRERGNFWYVRGETSLSIQCYRRALEFLDEAEGGIQYPSENQPDVIKISDELRELFDDRIKTLNNMAQAQLKLQAYEPALNSVDAVLKCQPNNVKALFRKGKILAEKGSTVEALEVLKTASGLEPDNKAIQLEMNQLTKRKKKEHHTEKQLYKRMFNDSKDKSSDSKTNGENAGSPYKSAFTVGLALTGMAVAAAGVLAYRGFRHH